MYAICVLQQSTGLFRNYADDDSTFDDAAGTAILASTVYRLALLAGIHTHLPLAEKSRSTLSAPSSSSSSSPSGSSTSTAPASSSTAASLAHFTSDMWLTPVVNPNNIGNEGEHSPEGQAFVVEMYAAWRDWVAVGAPGANAAVRLHAALGLGHGALVAALVAVLASVPVF